MEFACLYNNNYILSIVRKHAWSVFAYSLGTALGCVYNTYRYYFLQVLAVLNHHSCVLAQLFWGTYVIIHYTNHNPIGFV
jgi:aspartate/tyrosine/aromatic aminotransferase